MEKWIIAEKLPSTYLSMGKTYFDPILNKIREEFVEKKEKPYILGVGAPYATGKTTMCRYMKAKLVDQGYKVVTVSLDDFYKEKSKRIALAQSIHPLLRTRGVPGTHDLDLFKHFIETAKEKKGELKIPSFSKALDDRLDETQWTKIPLPIDFLILEGFCLKIPNIEPAEDLHVCMNDLERNEDPTCSWRNYVEKNVKIYNEVISPALSKFVYMKVDGWEDVVKNRQLQESKLREKTGSEKTDVMTEQQVNRFVQFSERLGRRGLKYLPAKADILIKLDNSQTVTQVIYN
eukprot:maker-scaffold_8-snap-gene-7.14-mRNA-1 protein AED:0.00 eAED:0.00 QI:238/1/1/1/1/1/2/50/289